MRFMVKTPKPLQQSIATLKFSHHKTSIIALFYKHKAGVAQLAEQLICNQQVISSSLIAGSILKQDHRVRKRSLFLPRGPDTIFRTLAKIR